MQPTVSTASNQLDPQAVNLAKAIRQTESKGDFNAKGASGEWGAYQYTKPTWDADNKAFGTNYEYGKATPEQQNELAYKKIKSLKDQGHNVGQVASIWNSGKPEWEGKKGVNKYGVKYDVPAYVDSVARTYQQYKQGNSNATPVPNASTVGNAQMGQPEQPQQSGGAWFKSNPDDSALEAGAKALGNTPQSAFNFAKGLVSSVNPLNIVKNIGEIGSQFSELSKESGGAGNALVKTLGGIPKATAETLVPQGVRQAVTGDIAGATKSFTEDPFGQTAPVVLALEGGAKLADNLSTKSAMAKYASEPYTQKTIPKPTTTYSDAFGKGVETIAKPAMGGVNALGKVASLPLKVAGSFLSHLTSLDTSTIAKVLSDPAEFSKIKQESLNRPNIASEFSDAIDNFIETKRDTGTEYNAIRTMDKPVPVPSDLITKVLGEYKLGLKKGKVTFDTKSLTRDAGDVRAIQHFVDNWGKKVGKTITAEEYLNMRGDIEKIAKHGKEIGTNKGAARVGKTLYDTANKEIGSKIPGLRDLDSKMSPLIEQYKQIKKDFLNPDGTFKDGAINKIANATGKGKVNLLSRMEEIAPGIGKKIELLKAVEDIERAKGIKVGSYTRSLLEGGAMVTGNIPLVISAILTAPGNAVAILRSAGLAAAQIPPLLAYLKLLAGDVPKEVLKKGSFNQDALQSQSKGLLPLRSPSPSSRQ